MYFWENSWLTQVLREKTNETPKLGTRDKLDDAVADANEVPRSKLESGRLICLHVVPCWFE